MSFWFHGTTEENAKQILKEGFQRDTFFGKHLEDALGMGGNWIFWLWFKENPTKYWEWVSNRHIAIDEIFALRCYNPVTYYYNSKWPKTIREHSHKEIYGPKAIDCDKCEGKGQMEDFNWFEKPMSLTVCGKCKGFGIINHEECVPDYYV